MSESRVRIIRMESCLNLSRSFSASARLMSFSSASLVPTLPGSIPPCPASITIDKLPEGELVCPVSPVSSVLCAESVSGVPFVYVTVFYKYGALTSKKKCGDHQTDSHDKFYLFFHKNPGVSFL